jgi:hypothetical protein
MPVEPERGKVIEEQRLFTRKHSLVRKGCRSCPGECGLSKAAGRQAANLARLQICLLEGDPDFPIIWCGAPAMDRENVG